MHASRWIGCLLACSFAAAAHAAVSPTRVVPTATAPVLRTAPLLSLPPGAAQPSRTPAAVAVWTQASAQGLRVWLAELHNGAWSAPLQLPSDGGDDYLPSAAIDARGQVWVAWSHAGGGNGRDLRWACCQDGRVTATGTLATGLTVNLAPALACDGAAGPLLVWCGVGRGQSDIYWTRWERDHWRTAQRLHAANTVPDVRPELASRADGTRLVRWYQYAGANGYLAQAACWRDAQWTPITEVGAPPAPQPPIAAAAAPIGRAFRQDAIVAWRASGCSWQATRRPDITVSAPSVPKAAASSVEASVIGFGDSITQGYPYLQQPGQGRTSGGYITILNLVRDFRVQPTTVYNYGWGGETTITGVGRLPGVLASVPGVDQVLIMEGTNDEWSGVPASATVFNLEVMVNLTRAAGATPIVATLTPASRDTNHDIEYRLNPMIVAMTARLGVTLCDQYAALAPFWSICSDDGLHPNALGYALMALTWHRVMPAVTQ